MKKLDTPSSGKGRHGRRPPTRELRRSFLIVCEGAVTEVLYFEAFRVSKDVRLVVRGEGKSTLSLVDAAVDYAQRAATDGAAYNEVWVVYDHDDFGADYFNRAAEKIRALNDTRGEKWHAAWSHESFEVWYLLHFEFFEGRLHRHLINQKLGERLGATYRKNHAGLYEFLLKDQPRALKHAEQLAKNHRVAPFGDTPPAQANPCTQVYRLVEALNAEIR